MTVHSSSLTTSKWVEIWYGMTSLAVVMSFVLSLSLMSDPMQSCDRTRLRPRASIYCLYHIRFYNTFLLSFPCLPMVYSYNTTRGCIDDIYWRGPAVCWPHETQHIQECPRRFRPTLNLHEAIVASCSDFHYSTIIWSFGCLCRGDEGHIDHALSHICSYSRADDKSTQPKADLIIAADVRHLELFTPQL